MFESFSAKFLQCFEVYLSNDIIFVLFRFSRFFINFLYKQNWVHYVNGNSLNAFFVLYRKSWRTASGQYRLATDDRRRQRHTTKLQLEQSRMRQFTCAAGGKCMLRHLGAQKSKSRKVTGHVQPLNPRGTARGFDRTGRDSGRPQRFNCNLRHDDV